MLDENRKSWTLKPSFSQSLSLEGAGAATDDAHQKSDASKEDSTLREKTLSSYFRIAPTNQSKTIRPAQNRSLPS